MEHSKSKKQSNAAVLTVVLVLLALLSVTFVTVFSTIGKRAENAANEQAETKQGQIVIRKEPQETVPVIVPETKEDTPVVKPIEETEEANLPVSAPLRWTCPVEKATVTQGFDPDRLVYSATMEDWRVHLGVDYECAAAADVYAAAEGTVTNIVNDPFEGICVTVSHADGYESVYKNLAPTLCDGIQVGKQVKIGQTIGSIGESAMIEIAQEPHLHFELYKDGAAIDPESVLPVDN